MADLKKIAIIFLVIIILLALSSGLFNILGERDKSSGPDSIQATGAPIIPTAETINDSERILIVAENLDTPWAIAFLSNNEILLTERGGLVKLINEKGEISEIANLTQVREIGEGGLLGITLHPDFTTSGYVYFYYTYSNSGDNALNRVVRMTLRQTQSMQYELSDEQIIVDQIPGAANHNGGRIKFGPDKFLYIATGDAQEPSLAQNRNSLAGKILRVTDNGTTAPGNPFGTRVFSYGHRNPQGITWSEDGTLYISEHGPSGGQFGTGQDEINLISSGLNFGWPEIIGDDTKAGMKQPFLHSRTDTWAPSGIAYFKYEDLRDALFFGGLRGEALYEINFTGDGPVLNTHLKNEFGRIREVILGPDNMLYITTSNRDGRGSPDSSDDKILKINPRKL